MANHKRPAASGCTRTQQSRGIGTPRRLPGARKGWCRSATPCAPAHGPRATAGRAPCLLTAVLSTAEDRHRDRFAPLLEGPLDYLFQLLGELMARDEDRGLRRHAGLVLVGNEQVPRPLPLLLGLVGDCPVDRLPRLAQSGRAFDQ